jgi:hypothetical protein
MLYRVLGVLSLAIGVLFALIAVLIFLPFLSNYNTSLLVLTLIFAIFAWVFGSIGWQLLHPPRPRGDRVDDIDGVDATSLGAGPGGASARAASVAAVTSAVAPDTSSIEPAYIRTASRAAAAAVDPAVAAEWRPAEDGEVEVLDAFEGFGGDGAEAVPGTRAESGAPSNGRSVGGARPQFRKPGSAVPPDRALG